MSRIRTAFLRCALVLSMLAAAAQSASAQAAAPAQSPKPANIHARATQATVDSSIPDDPAVEKMLQVYAPKVRALNEVIGKTTGELEKGGIGAGSLGNLVADALRDRAQVKLGKPVLLAITNSGGLRKNAIAEGDLTAGDIFELLPFENALVTLDLTGDQLRRFFDVILKHRDAQSGARITFRLNEKKENEIVSVKLGSPGNEVEIDPKATYTIATIDYLVKRGGDYSILQEGQNLRPLGITMRDAVLDYVKSETAAGRPIKAKLDGRFRSDKPQTETEQPND
ncbi:MAG: 5'-nucleotidase C-terminal domain-containing protein [Acidobacteriota bacterium]|nr:5'-nucleotidase C-terminal domain-containing protein [Acidobacteriota bacterium]